MSRAVVGLKWVKVAEEAPFGKSKGRTLVQKAGLAFEREVGKALPNARPGVWLEFEDLNGRGFCQPDLVGRVRGKLVVLECKLTFVPEAIAQLRYLYVPVLEYLTGERVWGVVVCRFLSKHAQGQMVFGELRDAVEAGEAGRIPEGFVPVVHWGKERRALGKAGRRPAALAHVSGD